MGNSNQTGIDEYLLDDIVPDNQIYAVFFIPFVLVRLFTTAPDKNEIRLSIILCDIGSSGERQRILLLLRLQSILTIDLLPIQSKVVTEFAACGIAYALVPLYARLRVLFTAQEGDRFDYWVGNHERQWGLEVSGTSEWILLG